MIQINWKPLSVNKCWQGRRYKTVDYKDYEIIVSHLLPDKIEIPKGKLFVTYEFGISSKNADIDNPVKPLTDIISKKYGFNDKLIYRELLIKKDVKKNHEYIKIDIQPCPN